MSNYSVRKLKIGENELLDTLAKASGELRTKALVFYWRIIRKKKIWIKNSTLQKMFKSEELHSASSQAVIQQIEHAFKSWRKKRKKDPKAKPPTRLSRYYRITWKKSAIKIENNNLILSNGNYNKPVVLDNWKFEKPLGVEIGWNGKEYELRAIYESKVISSPKGAKVCGIDLGEIHIAASNDGKETLILNGKYLRSTRRYQNKTKAKLTSKIDKKKPKSKRKYKLCKSKNKQLRHVKNQVKDILHKQTSKLISILHERGIKIIVIGDLKQIRDSIDYGKKQNQKLHQWSFSLASQMIKYKAERLGMKVEEVTEEYTSQTCPQCGHRYKPKNRNYHCKKCGYKFHRDGVGAINIRAKYLYEYGISDSTVVGVMTSPTGLRYNPA
jgi:putative transposase